MAFAITSTCCSDATCVSVCPVNCIHPAPGEPGAGTTEQLYVDPRSCIDCGACADACPVDAVFPVDRLAGGDRVYEQVNKDFYDGAPAVPAWTAPAFPRSLPTPAAPLRVAVVGTGPAAAYTAQELVRSTTARVTMLDRLPVAGGLVRFGVAPDHPSTKRIGESFTTVFRHPRVRLLLGVEVGRDVSAAELAAHHDAVVYAVGADADRPLDVPGTGLPGCVSATDVVAWYNAHPEADPAGPDLSTERVVVLGTGNVALDVARVLLSDPDALAHTDIADHALAALRRSRVREVVLVGRRGPAEAFSRSELRGLLQVPGLRVVLEDGDGVAAALADPPPGSLAAVLAQVERAAVDLSAPPPPGRRLVLRSGSQPVRVLGEDRVTGLRVERAGRLEDLAAGLVVRAIGYRGRPVPGLPHDAATGTVPSRDGRVVDPATGRPVPGAYVVGWARRGPHGGIGANRPDAAATVDSLLDDAAAGHLPAPHGSARAFARLVRARRPDALGLAGLLAIDAAERRLGSAQGRPRVKLASVPELLAAGLGRSRGRR